MAEKTEATSLADEAFYSDMMAVLKRHLTPDTKERLLAIASKAVGMILAAQDQRTMTKDRAVEIINRNIELGNARMVFDLLDTKGSA